VEAYKADLDDISEAYEADLHAVLTRLIFMLSSFGASPDV
jgi:hypothetical protein